MTKYLFTAVVAVVALSATAQTFQSEFSKPRKSYVETVAVPNHADSRYELGQESALRVIARKGGKPLNGVWLRFKKGADMRVSADDDSIVFKNGEVVIPMGSMSVPGFLACQYEFVVEGKRYADIVKVAYAPEKIQTLTPMPEDFDDFWGKALKEAREVGLQPEVYDVPTATTELLESKLVRLRVGKEKSIWGYLTRPRDGKKHPVVLLPPGAGSTKTHPSDYFPHHGFIFLKIEIHDNDPRIPDAEYNKMRKKKCEGYTQRGLASRDTYYYKDVYVGCARAVDYLCSLPDWDGRNVIVTGGSQGGALTIVTAALNEKVTLCAPFYPALCDLLGFLHGRAGGWPKFYSGNDFSGKTTTATEQAVKVLPYFDVVNFARLLKVPTFMSWGYSDDTCSPTSIWAAWNVITASKECDITPSSGHWRFQSSQERCLQWMKKNIK